MFLKQAVTSGDKQAGTDGKFPSFPPARELSSALKESADGKSATAVHQTKAAAQFNVIFAQYRASDSDYSNRVNRRNSS